MNSFFFQPPCPFFDALESCAEVLAAGVTRSMKFDAIVSRAVHAMNRVDFDQRDFPAVATAGPTVVRSAAEYFKIGNHPKTAHRIVHSGKANDYFRQH
ncbi:MAG TPA: hypothetical protein VH724_11005 [Candidatus Angelobacter sp.]|jgi:hypothetical protein|nr:hypothetical protein [Candidatus Angelobacter sp.]